MIITICVLTLVILELLRQLAKANRQRDTLYEFLTTIPADAWPFCIPNDLARVLDEIERRP